ncbi:MAG: radical SAM protein [Deltaproteobacteria bacterium]|nr:radical SAM protein [Deltaproteobacteria bacterium]
MPHYASQYLNIYPSHRGSSILFHGVTGAIDDVDAAMGHWLKQAQRQQHPLDDRYATAIINFLVQRGHVTTLSPEAEWESFTTYVSKLHAQICEERQTSGFLMLVASYYCNLACAYCYQNPMRAAEGQGAAAVMTREQVERIFTRVLPQLYPRVPRMSQVSVNLYGGEPFLERNYPALKRVLAYTQDYQMSVSAISNATTLDHCLPFFGVRCGLVNSLQISFDGSKLHHDQSRITHYGAGTFDLIIANIHRLLDRGVQINLRTNTNKQTVDTLKLLWDDLEREEIIGHPNVSIYAAAIHNHFNQADPKPLFSPATLTRRMEQMAIPMRTPLQRKMSRVAGIFDAESGVPLHRTNFCMQNMPNAFLLDHRGDIYSCYEEAGNRHLRVGTFDGAGTVAMADRYATYQSRHVGKYEPCARCSVALTCGGGCAAAARGTNWTTGTIFTNHCDAHRELVAMSIQRIFEQRVEGLRVASPTEDEWAVHQPYL